MREGMSKRAIWCEKKRNVFYVNESFFEKWSPDMAYTLGFFAADGGLTFNKKRKNYYIEFTSTDREILEKIKKIINAEQKIGVRNNTNSNWQKAYRLQLGSKKIFQDLCQFGFIPKKSLTVKFPKVPSKYLCHFIRGYFDGDGHCSFCWFRRKNRPNPGKVILSGFTSGSIDFLKTLKNKLRKYALIYGGTLHFHDGYRLAYSTRDSKKLYQFMYNEIGQSIYLERKYLVFQKAFRQYGPVA